MRVQAAFGVFSGGRHTARRIPIEAGLWTILQRMLAERDDRKPTRGRTSPLNPGGSRTLERFTRDLVFVNTCNSPLDSKNKVYNSFRSYCKRAGIEVKRVDSDGHEIDHVDVHSLRRTFATSLIERAADPNSVQEYWGTRRWR